MIVSREKLCSAVLRYVVYVTLLRGLCYAGQITHHGEKHIFSRFLVNPSPLDLRSPGHSGSILMRAGGHETPRKGKYITLERIALK